MLREGKIEYLRAGKSLLSGRERQNGDREKTDCFMGVQENFRLNMKNCNFANFFLIFYA